VSAVPLPGVPAGTDSLRIGRWLYRVLRGGAPAKFANKFIKYLAALAVSFEHKIPERLTVAPVFGHITYIAVTALIINVAVSVVLTLLFRKIGLQDGYDETRPADYLADPRDRAHRRGPGQDPGYVPAR
jgi:hypothetical protein